MRSLLKIPPVLLLLLPLLLPAQNLVSNPSFEEYTECPTGISQIVKAAGWKNYGVQSGTPDYFHICSLDSTQGVDRWYIMAGIPYNLMGHQHAKDGSAYAGLYTFSWDKDIGEPFREIIGIQLKQPLTIGKKYFVSFWVSPGFGSYPKINVFNSRTGARFSMLEYDGDGQSTNPAPVDNNAHVYTDSIFTDTTLWHLISGSFVPDKQYRYLMIGNFFDNAHTDTIRYYDPSIPINYTLAYHYIDNICVSSDSADCAPWDTIIPKEPEINCYSGFTLYPNPTISEFTITFDCDQEKVVRIYDVIGRLVIHKTLISEIMEYDVQVDHWASGMYFVEVKYGQKAWTKKVVIQ